MKNLKCKMKKMTYPPISQTTLITTRPPFLWWPAPTNKNLKYDEQFFLFYKKHYETFSIEREHLKKEK